MSSITVSPRAKRDSSFRIGLVQMPCSLNAEENLSRAIEGITEGRRGSRRRDRVPSGTLPQPILLPGRASEVVRSGREHTGTLHRAISGVAKQLQVSVVASLFEKRAQGLYHNTAAIIDADGSLVGIYRKMHIPDDPLYYEKFYFTPGDLGFRNFDTPLRPHRRAGLLGPMVSGRRAHLVLRGANVLFYPTAIGWHPSEKEQYGDAQLDAWHTIQRAHAIANGVFVAAVNRTGFEGPPESGIEFWGTRLSRSFRARDRASFSRSGSSGRGMRPEGHGRSSQELALPSRPAHRRLLAHRATLARLG